MLINASIQRIFCEILLGSEQLQIKNEWRMAMAIYYDENKKIFQLNTNNTTYLIGIVDEQRYIGHIYYGRRMETYDGAYLLRTEEAPFTPSVNKREKGAFLDCFPMEYPTGGVGDYRESCFNVRTSDGYRGCELHYTGHRIYNGKSKLSGLPATFASEQQAQTLELICKDECLDIEVTLLYSVIEECDIIARSVQIKNCSKSPIYLEKVLSACLDMDNQNFEMMTLNGSWARERHIAGNPISWGKQSISSIRGESSHQAHPFLAITTPNTTQDFGEVYAMHFVYSGNFLAQAELSQFESVRMVMGIHPEGFEWKLGENEQFQAPEVILTYSAMGIGKMTKNLHDLYRNHLIRSPYLHQKRPILINNWEATYFDFTSEKLLAIAKEAKRLGIEMLVMDDGWFGKRNSDDCSLGDWTVNEDKIIGGLEKLVTEIKKIGLKFGIWFEPEMISPDSNLYREHPDWAIQIPGREGTLIRCQYVLDLSRKEVRDYAYESIASILRSADIDYVKWDMNRQLTDMGSWTLAPDCKGELYHRYVLGLYEMQERLVEEFPQLLLENCSGGGARFDPGMLYYSPQIWCSDDTDAIERLNIQEGTAMIYPLSVIGAHVSDCPNHTVGRNTPFQTRGHVALAGTFGYELDITKIPEQDRQMIPAQVEDYHKYNDLIREGDYDRIASWRENHNYDCWQVTAKDGSEALLTYVQVLSRANFHSRKICLKSLIPNADYYLEETGQIYRGEMLMYGGFLIPTIFGDFESHLYHFIKLK